MKTPLKILIVTALAVAVAAVVVLKSRQNAAETKAPPPAPITAATALPKLIDLGADKCIPCKQMAPILEELKKDYAGRFDVEFIDVWKNEGAGKQFGVEMIPTQIFFDAGGKELFRHTGFFSREDILAKWKELGVEFKSEVRGPKAEGK
jgi:thioredoxin 1